MKISNYDKILHFWVNFLIVQTSKWFGYLPIGIVLAFVASFGKELYDKYIKKSKFDWEDILADVTGIITAVV